MDLEFNILKILYVYVFWVPKSAFLFHREPRKGFERLGLNTCIRSQGKHVQPLTSADDNCSCI